MKKAFSSIAGFLHRHPGFKTTVVGIAGTALTLAGQGAFGPKGAVIAGAISGIAGLFIKRPQDGAGTAPPVSDLPSSQIPDPTLYGATK
jgi:hypothetical protein